MPVHPNVRRCTHIQITGHRCGSPALKQEYFCYFHTRMIKGVQTRVDSQIHPIALIENAEAIQAAIMHTIDAVLKGTMDNKRSNIVLKALYIAVRNSRNVYFHLRQDEMVRQVPNYAQQYLIEHPELDSPAPDQANPVQKEGPLHSTAEQPAPNKKPCHPERAHQRESKDPHKANGNKNVARNSNHPSERNHENSCTDNTPPLTNRQSESWHQIKKLEACIDGAMRGNWRDLRTVFNAAGLTPFKPPTTQTVEKIAPQPDCHSEQSEESAEPNCHSEQSEESAETDCHSERSEESAVRLEAGKCNVR
jgi:hypothetical protein